MNEQTQPDAEANARAILGELFDEVIRRIGGEPYIATIQASADFIDGNARIIVSTSVHDWVDEYVYLVEPVQAVFFAKEHFIEEVVESIEENVSEIVSERQQIVAAEEAANE